MEKTINEALGYICEGRTREAIEMAGLFDEWYHKTAQIGKDITDGFGHYGLVCDGIMRKRNISDEKLENDWWEGPMRIAFLMKDQNQKGDVYNTDARNWLLQKDKAWELQNKTFHNIANILWGLIHATKDYPCFPAEMNTQFNEIKHCFQTRPFAYIECKKQGGGPKIDDNVLKNYMTDYKELLYKEFNILKPNVFVCTSGIIFDFVKQYLQDKYALKADEEFTPVISNKDKSKYEQNILLHMPSKSIILLGYHPTVRKSYETIYEGVMDHYRAFVQSEHFQDFFDK